VTDEHDVALVEMTVDELVAWLPGEGATRLALSVFGSAASTQSFDQLGYVVTATSMFRTIR
jgi:hypothetical protein